MSILKKIKQFRANHKIASAISDGAAVFAAGNVGGAAIEALIQPQTPHIRLIQDANADFFDGCRGQNTLQLDQRIALGENSAANYTLLPKVFVDTDKDGKGLFGVAPFNYTPNHKPNAGIGIGGFYDLGKVSFLGVVPVVYSAEGKATNINPSVFVTIMKGNFLADPRISYLASIPQNSQAKTTHHLNLGTTVGYAIDNVVVGVDAETGFDAKNHKSQQLKDGLKYQGILRIDLDEKHRNWVQTYAGKDAVGIGFRANFK